MQEGSVGWVHAVLFDLQPVAGHVVLAAGDRRVAIAGMTLFYQRVVQWEGRLLGRGPHVGKDQPLVLQGRVSPVAQPVLEGAVGRLAGGLEDAPVHIHQPAMVAAAYALLRHQAELQ